MFFRNQDCTDISELSNTSENDEQNAKALVWNLSILQWFLISNGNLKIMSEVENVDTYINSCYIPINYENKALDKNIFFNYLDG